MATKLVAARLPEDLLSRVDAFCSASGDSRTALIVDALEVYLAVPFAPEPRPPRAQPPPHGRGVFLSPVPEPLPASVAPPTGPKVLAPKARTRDRRQVTPRFGTKVKP